MISSAQRRTDATSWSISSASATSSRAYPISPVHGADLRAPTARKRAQALEAGPAAALPPQAVCYPQQVVRGAAQDLGRSEQELPKTAG